MAVNYDTPTKSQRMQKVIDAIDSGAGNGVLEICSAAFAAVLGVDPVVEAKLHRSGRRHHDGGRAQVRHGGRRHRGRRRRAHQGLRTP